MPLNLDQLLPQVGGMITRLKAEGAARQERLQYALDTLHAQDRKLSNLARKIAAAKTTWLVAGLVDGLDRCYKPPPTPNEFTILATDGSHIAVDRHRSTHCYLINIGEVIIRYGKNPDATLDIHSSLYFREEELAIPTGGAKGREQPIEGNLLGIKRSVDECQRLAIMAKDLPKASLSLALVDGSIILWSLEAYPDFAVWTATERIKEAQDVGAEAIVTACGWCENNFRNALKENGYNMKVYDIVELLEMAI